MARWLSDLKMSHDELFARVVEGICPGCGRALDRREVREMEATVMDCGWCELCAWGWRAYTYRGEPGHWQPGERLVTVYAEGALVTSSATEAIVE